MKQQKQVEFLRENQEHFALLTQLECEYYQLMESGFSKEDIANKRGIGKRCVSRSVEGAVRKIENHLEKSKQVLVQQVPDGHIISGVSTYNPQYNQWIKTKLDDDYQKRAFEEAVANTTEKVNYRSYYTEQWMIDKVREIYKKDIELPKNIVLLNIPPYCPELNPAEKVWQQMKKRWQ